MRFKGYSYMGTLIAIVAIVVVVLLSKFVFKEEEIATEKEIPQEETTLGFVENTSFGTVPTE